MSISLIAKPLPSSTVATVQELRDWLRSFSRSGVVANAGGEFEVTHSAGLVLDVATGRAVVDGISARLNDAGTVTLAAADGTHPRIDRVVLRLDPTGNGSVSVQVRTGTPAASPVTPALTQSVTGVWEEPLLSCTVAASATTPSSLVDERGFLADGPVGVTNLGSSGAALEVDLGDGAYQSVTVSEACDVTFAGWPTSGSGAYVTLEVSMGTEFAVTWPAEVKWHGDEPPALAADTRTLVVLFSRDGGTTVEGSYGSSRTTV